MNPWKSLRGLPAGIWMLSFSTLINRAGTLVVFFLAIYLIQGRGWSEKSAATALALSGLGSLLASPFSGPLADRVGHRRLLAWSLLSSALTVLGIPYLRSPLGLMALVFVWSALTQAFWPASMALITELAPPELRKQAFVLHRLASNLGIAVGPAVGGFLAKWSFPALFWIDGITTLLGLGILLLGVPKSPPQIHEGKPSLSAWSDRRLLGLLLALLPATLVFTQIHGSLPLWVSRDLGFGPRIFGLVFTLNTLLIVAFEVAINHGLSHWPHRRQLALGALLIGLGFGLTGLGNRMGLLALCVCLWSLGEMVLLPAASDAVATLAPQDRRGEYMGLYSLTWTLSMTLGPWLGLMGYTRMGAQGFWPLCGLVALAGALLMLRFRPPSPRS